MQSQPSHLELMARTKSEAQVSKPKDIGEFSNAEHAVGLLTPTVTIKTKSRSPMWWATKESVKRPAGG